MQGLLVKKVPLQNMRVEVRIFPEGTVFSESSQSECPGPYDVMVMDEKVLKSCSPVIERMMSDDWAGQQNPSCTKAGMKVLNICYSPPESLQAMLSCAEVAYEMDMPKSRKRDRDGSSSSGGVKDLGRNLFTFDVNENFLTDEKRIQQMISVCSFYDAKSVVAFIAGAIAKQCQSKMESKR